MRQYLQLLGILGAMVACSGNTSAGDGNSSDAMTTPSAGSASQGATAGAATPPNGGVASAGTASGGAASGSTAAAGSGASSAGMQTTAGAGSGGAAGSSAAGMANAGAAGAAGKPLPGFKFPMSSGADQKLTQTMTVTDFDGKMARYIGSGALGGSGQAEGQDPLFLVKAGGSLKNVILGAPAADGVHCEGSCTIDNVWWEDVGEDAITFEGKASSNTYRLSNSGARHASDKVIQHNGAGTAYIKNFYVEDFGKLYRSCGNYGTQYERHVGLDTIVAVGGAGVIAGINANYQDSAKLTNIFPTRAMKIYERYQSNDTGAEPNLLGSDADGTNCIYAATDITLH